MTTKENLLELRKNIQEFKKNVEEYKKLVNQQKEILGENLCIAKIKRLEKEGKNE